MIETMTLFQDNLDELGLSSKVEGITTGVVTDYGLDLQGNVIGIARQETRFCRIMVTPPDGTITISALERGFAISILFEDFVKLLTEAGYTPLND